MEFRPSTDAFKALLMSFGFVQEVEVHMMELPFWATKYDILCTLKPLKDRSFDEAEAHIRSVLSMAIAKWRTKVDITVRDCGEDGDVVESLWRLGA